MFQEIRKKIEKTNEQRIQMALSLVAIMQNKGGDINLVTRTSVAASMLNMLNTSMIEEDASIIKVLNEGIDSVCKDAETFLGKPNFREKLLEIIEGTNEQIEHIERGETILKSLNLDNINLN